MGMESSNFGPQNSSQEKQVLSPEELEEFRRELQPIFDERFITLGHGTRLGVAEDIMNSGLLAKAPEIATTTIGLENTEEGLNQILNWKHLNSKAIIVIMFPRDKRIHQSQVWEENKDADGPYDNKYILPSKFIKGYINVNSRKLILNDKFEENPEYKEAKIPEGLPKIGKGGGNIEVPDMSKSGGEEDVW